MTVLINEAENLRQLACFARHFSYGQSDLSSYPQTKAMRGLIALRAKFISDLSVSRSFGSAHASSRRFSIRYQLVGSSLFFRGAFAKKLCDIKVDEIRVVKNDRFDRPLDLVAFVAVRSDDVQDFPGDSVLVGERNATEWMAQL